MAYREDDEAALRRRQQLARELATGTLDTEARDRAEHALAEIDAARIDAARVRLPQVARARIASPCHERWDTMLGDGAVRSCSRCEKEVFDLSQMTLGQAEALIAERGGDLCVRLYRRADGTMMFADCVVGARGVAKRQVAIAGAAMAIGSAALAWASQPAPARATYTTTGPSAEAHPASERFLHSLPPEEIDAADYPQGLLLPDTGASLLDDVIAGGGSRTHASFAPSGEVTVVSVAAVGSATLDLTLVARGLARRRSALRGHYERALAHDPDLGGRLVVRITVVPLGVVETVRVMYEFPASDVVAAGIVRVLRGLRFVRGPATPETFEITLDLAPD